MRKDSFIFFQAMRNGFSGCAAIPLCLCIAAAAAPCASIADSVSAYLSQRGYKPSNVGIIIKKLGTDSILVALNEQQRFNPASVSKLVTASAAIDLLGVDYRFATTVFIDGALDRDSGRVRGNLYIRGGGDPGFLAERLWLFVQHLAHLGIRRIERDLVLDDSFFDASTQGPGFDEDKSSRAYEAPTAALSASFNTVAVHVAPGTVVGSPVQIHTLPRISGVKIVATALTMPAGAPSDIQVTTEKMDGKTAILVYGGMNIDAKPRYIYRKVWETWENFGWVMQGLFEECGIRLDGKVRHGVVPDSLKAAGPLYTFESQPLFEFIGHMFKVSSNFAAEMVFKTIAAHTTSRPGSWSAASEIVGQWWTECGLPGSIKVMNGSGMGNGNRISALQIAALLERVWSNKAVAPDFISALPIAGVDGTLEKRFGASQLKGIMRAKTGTLNNYGVSTLAGFVFLGADTYVFAILMNNSGADQYKHWESQQKILEMVFAKH